MARREDKSKAIELRLKGWSYSQIKQELGVGKSTLSNWLFQYPLSEERIKELQAARKSDGSRTARIERCINTKRLKREKVQTEYFHKAADKIGILTDRELFIAGLFLYWAEGGKTQKYSLTMSNTNPAMIKFFIKWLLELGAVKEKIKIRMHFYKDMNVIKEQKYWSELTTIPAEQFCPPYIKDSLLSNLTYKSGYGHGTCNVIYHNKEIAFLVHMGLSYINQFYNRASLASSKKYCNISTI